MLGYSWFIPSWVAEDRVARLKHLNVLLDITHNENISRVAAFISDAVPRSTNPDQIALGNGGGDSVGGTAGWESGSCPHPALPDLAGGVATSAWAEQETVRRK